MIINLLVEIIIKTKRFVQVRIFIGLVENILDVRSDWSLVDDTNLYKVELIVQVIDDGDGIPVHRLAQTVYV